MNVILLHGLLMNDWAMRPLGKLLEKQGFTPVYFRYATTRANPREHARALAQRLLRHQLAPCHFVAHSLGGLVLRHLAEIYPDLTDGARVVTLGTPHGGSATAAAVRRYCPALVGRAWDWGLDGRVPPRARAWGNIAGTAGWGAGRWLGVLAQPNDGTVAVAETALSGSLPLHLPCSHTGLLLDREAAAQTAHFLRYGQWDLHGYHRLK
ncbi:esterase/lipase family protein [Conchiformibius kuhniae]|uniref:Esterase/lipase family protein n=1 Tax=Conchiformibius kuhniae TaxID=211502 RepID=A0A8T9MTR1_9NEIS|nr:hypothetical protein [Conchiformibius kuhniae]UOP04484.1 acetyltransferase [Conchiformibius kuhniae]